VKQRKILFIIVLSLLSLTMTSCMSTGTQPAQGWSGVAYHEGVLYTGSMDGAVVAVNPATRTSEWSYDFGVVSSGGFMSCGQTSAPVAMYGTPVVDGDLVYAGLYDGRVLALSSSARRQNLSFPQMREGEWVYPKKGEVGGIVGDLVMSNDAIYVASSDGKVYSLDKVFGDSNWESDILSEKLWKTPVIEDDALYVSTFDGHIYSLSTKDGALLPWAFKADIGFASSPAIYQDTIFVGAFDNNLYAIKIGGNEPLWKFQGGRWFWAAPVIRDGIVYAGCLDGKMYAISAETGELKWECDTHHPVVSSPVWDGDLLIVADEAGEIFVFDTNARPENKVMLPMKTISINASVQGALCIHDEIVYVHAQDNCLYALDIARGGINWKLSLTGEEAS